MPEDAVNIEAPFRDVFTALDLKAQRKALRGAMRREGNRLKKAAVSNLESSGIGTGTKQRLSRGIMVRVYPERMGAGFMVSVKPWHKKGYHTNRQGLEKPVLMWAEEGVAKKGAVKRKTRSQSKFFVRKRKGHNTGRMRSYRFLARTESNATSVEANLFRDFQANLDKALKKQGLV